VTLGRTKKEKENEIKKGSKIKTEGGGKPAAKSALQTGCKAESFG
jgi:hypothetical protein